LTKATSLANHDAPVWGEDRGGRTRRDGIGDEESKQENHHDKKCLHLRNLPKILRFPHQYLL
jgi:hypothetical protein